MAYQALYRKYRPHSFDDFIDQDNVKQIITNSIKSNKVSHAYLFSGPRGIGKTSMAKIFAKAVNCLNFDENNDVCDKCDNCIEYNENTVDIIEIDAASNNGVDQIRELKNKISVLPSKLKYKIYIVDEVHMLTSSAFNALLKTIEEPPSHVIFILATTEFYEVPETIVSRCQCFNFSRISMDSLIKRLKYISEKENINIEDDVLKEIAEYSNGGLRDAIGLLDKLNSYACDKITMKEYKELNGLVSQEDILKVYNALIASNASDLLDVIDKIDRSGYDFKYFVERLMYYIRNLVVDYYTNNANLDFNVKFNIQLIESLNELLNKLKLTLNPLIVTQVEMLKLINLEIISREIISNNQNKIISREIKSSSGRKNKVEINENVQNIYVNNSFVNTDAKLRKKINESWNDDLTSLFENDEYGKIAQYLLDTEVISIGECLLLSANGKSTINFIYNNYEKTRDLFNKLYNFRPLIVALMSKDAKSKAEEVKNNYLKGIKCSKIECSESLLTINNDSLMKQGIDLFGDNVTEE